MPDSWSINGQPIPAKALTDDVPSVRAGSVLPRPSVRLVSAERVSGGGNVNNTFYPRPRGNGPKDKEWDTSIGAWVAIGTSKGAAWVPRRAGRAAHQQQRQAHSSPEAVECTDDETFAARHAPFEALERRGFMATSTPSIEEGLHAPSHAAAEELRKCRATAARSPDRVVKLGPSCAEQLVGQRLLVPTHVFGDVPSNLVYEGIVTQRTRGRADCVVSRRRC